MQIYKFFIVMIGVILVTSTMAETCVKSVFNLTYSCGAGTLISGQTLPATESAQYGGIKYSVSSLYDICTPPSGYYIAGHGYFIDGEMVSPSTYGWRYYYTSDMTIEPIYKSKTEIADVSQMVRHINDDYLNINGFVGEYASKATTGTWWVAHPYGVVQGKHKCVSLIPEIPQKGIIPDNQDEITNASLMSSSAYVNGACYCKITQPVLEWSPWVLGAKHSGANCYNNCAATCAMGVSTMLKSIINGNDI